MTGAGGAATLGILLVEDSPSDRMLTLGAMRGCGVPHRVLIAETGPEALEILASPQPWPDATRPDLVLLDLNLPGLSGHEILREMKASTRHRTIPVVVLSTSAYPDDVAAAYAAGANSYVVKPLEVGRLRDALGLLLRFWSEHAVPPPEVDERADGDCAEHRAAG